MSLTNVFSQYLGGTRINHNNVKDWVAEEEYRYYGVYHFGVSENESTLVVFSSGSKTVAQIRSGSWNDDATSWVWTYKNLTNPFFHNNELYSDEYHGEFVFYTNETGEQNRYLAIYDSWSGITDSMDDYELGVKGDSYFNEFSGNYTQGSTTELSDAHIKAMSTDKLKIMRNEIFARYGYTFIKGGKMDTYFRAQSWYKPQHKNVDAFLTEIEKHNIKLIKKEELKRK